MTTEEYFKDKINWKVYNIIYDACIELQDAEKWFHLAWLNPIITVVMNAVRCCQCVRPNKKYSRS